MSVELRGVAKRFGDVVAIHELDLDVAQGELLVLLGPSGCGKSTALRIIAGLESPDAGEVRIDGRPVRGVAPKDRDVAMVFQSYALYPHLTVRQNLAFPLERRKMDAALRGERVRATAARLGLEALLDRRPGELSGGERQRVAMGRALVRAPRVFLFDEPLSNLDARLRVELRGLVAHLHRETGATSLYVTHDQVEAMALGDRVAVLEAGRLQQLDTPSGIYQRPANRFVATFVGVPRMNLVEAERQDGQLVAGPLRFAAASVAVDRALVGVRPEDLDLEPSEGANAVVERVEELGSEAHIYVRADATTLVARVVGGRPVRAGDHVRVRADPERVHLFDPTSGVRLERP